MIDVEYLKRLYRAKFVYITHAQGYSMNFHNLYNEYNLDALSGCDQICLSASLINHLGYLKNYCIKIFCEENKKQYVIRFKKEPDAKRVYSLFDFNGVSYDDFVSFLKASAKLSENHIGSFSSSIYVILEKKGKEVLFNNGSGNKKARSFERVVHDTHKDIAKKAKREMIRELG